MSKSSPERGDQGESSRDQHWERVADRFDTDRRACGESARIEDYLITNLSNRNRLLLELIKIEMEYRAREGATVRVEEYLRRFPELQSSQPSIEELACEEFWVRHCFGDRPSISSYIARFPTVGHTIVDQLSECQVQLRFEESGGQQLKSRRINDASRSSSKSLERQAKLGAEYDFDVPGYELLEPIGRGGSAVVYRARQLSLNRIVALKVIAQNRLVDESRVSRIRNEAEAAARLRHPGIVQIYDVGEGGGAVYCSMELAPFGSLDKFADAKPLHARLAAHIVAQLADAIEHAHANRIVHRDLKPANVVLFPKSFGAEKAPDKVGSQSSEHDDYGAEGKWNYASAPMRWPYTPKITDFGLAKRSSQSGVWTATVAIAGTPSYMSPEQAHGESLTVATDIYSLGAILYELLTGRPPFVGDSPLAVLQQIRNENHIPPSHLARVPASLELITLKCMRKNPRARYGSAAELKDDLIRFLENRPIQARPISIGTRLVLFTKQKPAHAASIALSMSILMLIAFGGYFLQWKTRQAYAREVVERKRADESLTAALDAIHNLLDSKSFVKLGDVPGMTGVREELSTEAINYYSQLLAQYESVPPHYERDFAIAHRHLGQIQLSLDKISSARKAFEQSRSLWERRLQSKPTIPQEEVEYATLLLSLGETDRREQQLDDAERTVFKALSLLEKVDGTVSVRLQVTGHELLSRIAADRGDLSQTEYHQLAAAGLAMSNASEFPGEQFAEEDVARVEHNLGLLYFNSSQIDEARTHFEIAREHWLGLLDLSPVSNRYRYSCAETLESLGMLLKSQGDSELGLGYLRDASTMREQLAVANPGVPEFRRAVARSLSNMATFDLSRGDFSDAEDGFRRAIAHRETLLSTIDDLPGDVSRLAECRSNLAVALGGQGKVQGAQEQYELSIVEFEKLRNKFPQNADYLVSQCAARQNLGTLLISIGKASEGLKELGIVIDELERLLQTNPKHADAKSYCLNAHGSRAQYFGSIRDFESALLDWARVIELVDDEKVRDRYRIQKCLTMARLRPIAASIDAKTLEESPNLSGEDIYNLACVFALAASVREDTQFELGSEGRVMDSSSLDQSSWKDHALDLLEDKRTANYLSSPTAIAHAKKDSDLKVLWKEPRFERQLDRLQQTLSKGEENR